jgi:hypothetical protein
MIHLLLFLLAWSGFAMLCLARDWHQRDVLGRTLSAGSGRRLRAAAAVCLLSALGLAGLRLGWAYGAVEWLGQLSAGALATVLLLLRLSGGRSSSR